jgi:protein TonB
MMRYLPFIIISFILYTLFFYNNQAPDLLSADASKNALANNNKVLPLDFDGLDKEQQAHSFTPVEQEPFTLAIPVTKKEKDQTKALASIEEHNAAKLKAFYTSIKSTPASDGALLKGELYERDFYLHLPAPPVKKKAPKKKKKKTAPKVVKKTKVIEADSLTSALLKQTNSNPVQEPSKVATTSSDKPKRSFKKSVQPLAVATEHGLQQAIAVSGNKPPYPKKAQSNKLQGSVNVKFIVSMQGKTKNSKIITSSGHPILDKAVLEFIKTERFMPALKGIEKITSEQQFSFKFSLK